MENTFPQKTAVCSEAASNRAFILSIDSNSKRSELAICHFLPFKKAVF
jgi:hypothetical protein